MMALGVCVRCRGEAAGAVQFAAHLARARLYMVNLSSEFRYNCVTLGTFCGDLTSIDAE